MAAQGQAPNRGPDATSASRDVERRYQALRTHEIPGGFYLIRRANHAIEVPKYLSRCTFEPMPRHTIHLISFAAGTAAICCRAGSTNYSLSPGAYRRRHVRLQTRSRLCKPLGPYHPKAAFGAGVPTLDETVQFLFNFSFHRIRNIRD